MPRFDPVRSGPAAFLFAALVTPRAFAGDVDDTVLLKNGGRVRGTVLEESPQTGVSVRVADGTIRTIPAAEVDHVVYPASGGATPPEPPRPTVLVHAEADRPSARLERLEAVSTHTIAFATGISASGLAYGASSHYGFLCTLPCDVRVDAGGLYRVAGPDFSPTPRFPLPPGASAVDVRVRTASDAALTGGIALSAAGLLLGGVGTTMIAVGGNADSGAKTWQGFGIAFVIMGVAALVPGLVLVATSGTTRATVAPRADAAAPRPFRLTAQGLTF